MNPDFELSLLREKFELKDPAAPETQVRLTALSNRIVLPLSRPNEAPETFVLRTQNMHSCTRLAAAIAREYFERGPLIGRAIEFRWDNLWKDVIKGYEKDWNPDIWCVLYHKGRPIFEDGAHHPFLDIIEKCDAANRGEYAESVSFAEKAFQQAGKSVTIAHESNIALIVTVQAEEARCGVILRGATKKTTFTFAVKEKRGGDPVRVPTILTMAAAFLEGVQLAFSVGITNRKKEFNMIEKYSEEDRKGRRGAERLINLTAAIETIEGKYDVFYRPERPDFQRMVREAEEIAFRLFKPPSDVIL